MPTPTYSRPPTRARLARRLALLAPLLAGGARADDQTEALVSACADGEMQVCQQLSLATGRPAGPPTPLELRAQAFVADPAVAALVGRPGEPDLLAGYPRVVEHYFATPGLPAEARARYLRADALPGCAAHYHEVWALERGWWPTDAQGAADWQLLYLHMLDHYFGYCLTGPEE